MASTFSPQVTIVGAGAAGLLAGLVLSRAGFKPLILEGQEKPGLKFLLSGGGRCNISNRLVSETRFGTASPRLLRNILRAYSFDKTRSLFEELGIPWKEEDEGRHFPVCGSSRKALTILLEKLEFSGAMLKRNHRVLSVSAKSGGFLLRGKDFSISSKILLLSTGGASFPETGSDGYGFRLAEALGHSVSPLSPALTPLTAKRKTYRDLSGISLPVRLTLRESGRKTREVSGPLLFTHQGFSGAAILNISRHWIRSENSQKKIFANFLPGHPEAALKNKLEKARHNTPGKHVSSFLSDLLPARFAEKLLALSSVARQKPLNQISRKESLLLFNGLFRCELPVDGYLGYDTAHATAGGIPLTELNAAAMESKIRPGLFFAGEMLDADGQSGGFNLQWAWSSAFTAASGIIRHL